MKIDPNTLDVRLSHRLFAAAVIPRPILLISSVSDKGVLNVAPYASVVVVCLKPRMQGFEVSNRRDGSSKDTLKNIEFSKDFVINTVDESMMDAMQKSSVEYPPDVSEFDMTGLTPVKADLVKAPLVGESGISMECRLVQILQFGEPSRRSFFIIGEVVMVHVKDELYKDGEIQSLKMKTIGRLGEDWYCRTSDVFEMKKAFNM